MKNLLMLVNTLACIVAVAMVFILNFNSNLKFEKSERAENVAIKVQSINDVELLKDRLMVEVRYSDSVKDLVVSGKNALKWTLGFFIFVAAANLYFVARLKFPSGQTEN